MGGRLGDPSLLLDMAISLSDLSPSGAMVSSRGSTSSLCEIGVRRNSTSLHVRHRCPICCDYCVCDAVVTLGRGLISVVVMEGL